MKTNLIDLDDDMGEMNPGEIVILGGRTGMGKTALALSLIKNEVVNGDKKCLYISLEDRAEIIESKLISNISGVDFGTVRQLPNIIGGGEYQRVLVACNQLKNFHCVDYRKYFDLGRSAELLFKSLQKDHPEEKSVIVLDYINLLEISDYKFDRVQEMQKILLLIKEYAYISNCPVIVLAQLSRKIEDRIGFRPRISDLRDCGCIEEIADKILLLLRREYYDPLDAPGIAQLIVAKNRQKGELAITNLTFRKEILQFCDYIAPVIDFTDYTKKD
jgi:replicative DNA helicase